MLRVMVLFGLLTPVAVDGSEPTTPDAAQLMSGDVICVGYDSNSTSCLVKQTISAGDANDITILDEMRLVDFGSPLVLRTLMTSKKHGPRYCLQPKKIRAVVVPETHASGPVLTIATVEGLNLYAQAEFCIEHRPCGDQYVALAFAGDLRFADEDMVYTLFRNGNPETTKLNTREMKIEELDAIKGFAPISCLPKSQ